MNDRLSKLIKQSLTDYGIYVLWAIGCIFASRIIGLIVRMVFNWGDDAFIQFFNIAGAYVIIMFICGIVAGAEIPAGVRQGISRVESFISESISAVIVSLLAGPSLLILNMIFQILPGSSMVASYWSFSTLVVQFFMYVAAFFVGMFIAILWQRIGWLPTVILIVITVLVTGWIGFNIATINITTTITDVNLDNLGDVIQEIVDNAIEGNQILFAQNHYSSTFIFAIVGIILVFGTATYSMVKKLAVRAI